MQGHGVSLTLFPCIRGAAGAGAGAFSSCASSQLEFSPCPQPLAARSIWAVSPL